MRRSYWLQNHWLMMGAAIGLLSAGCQRADIARLLTGANQAISNSSQTSQPSELTGQNVICDAPVHFTKIVWQEGQPNLTFAQKTGAILLDQSTTVRITSNSDGSRTYTSETDPLVYARFYLDGSCLIQALNPQGQVTVEEFGRTGAIGEISDITLPGQAAPSAEAEPFIQQIN